MEAIHAFSIHPFISYLLVTFLKFHFVANKIFTEALVSVYSIAVYLIYQ